MQQSLWNVKAPCVTKSRSASTQVPGCASMRTQCSVYHAVAIKTTHQCASHSLPEGHHNLNQPDCKRVAKFLTQVKPMRMNSAWSDGSLPGPEQTLKSLIIIFTTSQSIRPCKGSPRRQRLLLALAQKPCLVPATGTCTSFNKSAEAPFAHPDVHRRRCLCRLQ